MARKSELNASILEYALHHLEKERDELQARIDHVREQLGALASPGVPIAAPKTGAPTGPRKRVLSDAARKRIAAAQKRRWAEHRKRQPKKVATDE